MTEFRGTGVSVEITPRKMNDECGIFGILTVPGMPVAPMTYKGLQANQHRGQGGAGMSVANGHSLMVYSNEGTVKQAFKDGDDTKSLIEGYLATGHVRYATSATPDHLRKAALNPLYLEPGGGLPDFVLSINGHDDGAINVARRHGVDLIDLASDSDAIARTIKKVYQGIGRQAIDDGHPEISSFERALAQTLPQFQGASSLVASTPTELFTARDRHGFHPVHIGRLASAEGWVVSSEMSGLDIVGADHYAELGPGTLAAITGPHIEDIRITRLEKARKRICLFEFVYLSRPDNMIEDENVAEARMLAGELLAEEDRDLEVDMVLDAPESGKWGAIGYARARGLPYMPALVRNNYVDRSFITPGQDVRIQKVLNKMNPLRRMINGKRLVVVDDSMVRGTTGDVMVDVLRDAGAKEVHLRLVSDRIINSCHWGVDTGNPDELIARKMSNEEICKATGLDSIGFLPIKKLRRSVGKAAESVCDFCMTGNHPSDDYRSDTARIVA
jgi:amidophosphoribosyltransferase